MTDLRDERTLEGLYGPLYRYSDHKRGDHITYHDHGMKTNRTGTILWVCGPGPVSEGGPALGAHYVVEPDVPNWPDTVFPADVIMSVEKTPTQLPTRDIKQGDTVEYQGLHHQHLFGRAVRTLLPWQTSIDVESINTPGLIVPVRLTDIISVHRAVPGGDTISQSWE